MKQAWKQTSLRTVENFENSLSVKRSVHTLKEECIHAHLSVNKDAHTCFEQADAFLKNWNEKYTDFFLHLQYCIVPSSCEQPWNGAGLVPMKHAYICTNEGGVLSYYNRNDFVIGSPQVRGRGVWS